MGNGDEPTPRVLAIDAGGTMTDTFIVDEAGSFVVGKAQTTPEDESTGFMESARDALAQWETNPEDAFGDIVSGIYSGTAMLNRLLSRQGLEIGAIVSAGQEDYLRLERGIQTFLGYKDVDRFDNWVEVLQERVGYDEPIVLPVGEGLNVVRAAGGDLVTRCDCGHDLGRADRNWKLDAVVYVRDSVEAMREVYPKLAHADPEWMVLREFYCPSCARQLEVEASPPGYPVVHEFLPDVEGFYRGWLGRDVP